jgi:hypothetical protein
MEITEKELEDLMYEDLTTTGGRYLRKLGLEVSCMIPFPGTVKWLRQVRLEPYGIADIIGYRRCRGGLMIDIIELKNRPIECNDFDQVFRYRSAVREMFRNSRPNMEIKITASLIGREINSGHYIHNNCTHTNLYSFKFGLAGFRFERHENRWCKLNGELTINDWSAGDVKAISFLPAESN